jgi:hypothetical protein
MKRLLAILLMFTTAFAQAAAFVPGQVLTANALNTAFATAQITSGTVDGVCLGCSVPGLVYGTSLYSSTPDSFGYNATFNAFSSSDVPNAAMAFKSARGTVAAPTALQTGDLLGNIDYYGYGTSPAYAASIDTAATATFTGTSWPTQFNFNLTPVGSVTPQQAMSLAGSGILTLLPATSAIHIDGTDSNYYVLSALVNNNAVNGTGIQLGGGRGSQASPTATQSGDVLGNIDLYGYGTSYIEGASINATAGSAWSSTNAETYLSFWATAASSTTTSEKMRIASNGELLIGTTAVPSSTTTGSTSFPTTATGDLLTVKGGLLSLSTESAGNYNFTGLGYSTANTNNASLGLKSQTRGASAAQSGDTIGNIDAWGWNGTTYGYAASIDFNTAGAWSGSSYPSQISFNVTASGATAPATAMSVASAGVQLNVPVASSNHIYSALAVNSVTTVGAATLSAANLVGGVIMRSGSTAAYTDTTDTATNIVAAIPNAQINTSFRLRIVNSVAYVDTIAAGSGVTLSGTTAISASTFRDFVGVITSVSTPAVTLYGIGSGTL